MAQSRRAFDVAQLPVRSICLNRGSAARTVPPFSHFPFHISYSLFLISSFPFHISLFTFHISYLLFLISPFTFHISYFLFPIPHLSKQYSASRIVIFFMHQVLYKTIQSYFL